MTLFIRHIEDSSSPCGPTNYKALITDVIGAFVFHILS